MSKDIAEYRNKMLMHFKTLHLSRQIKLQRKNVNKYIFMFRKKNPMTQSRLVVRFNSLNI